MTTPVLVWISLVALIALFIVSNLLHTWRLHRLQMQSLSARVARHNHRLHTPLKLGSESDMLFIPGDRAPIDNDEDID